MAVQAPAEPVFLIVGVVGHEAYVRVVRGGREVAEELVPMFEYTHSTEARVVEIHPDHDDGRTIRDEYGDTVREDEAEHTPPFEEFTHCHKIGGTANFMPQGVYVDGPEHTHTADGRIVGIERWHTHSGWSPRQQPKLCNASFMAGAACELPAGHEGSEHWTGHP